jgi:hypothetical protein
MPEKFGHQLGNILRLMLKNTCVTPVLSLDEVMTDKRQRRAVAGISLSYTLPELEVTVGDSASGRDGFKN